MAPDGSLSARDGLLVRRWRNRPTPAPSPRFGRRNGKRLLQRPRNRKGDVLPVSNSTLKSDDTTGAPVSSSGFLGAPTTPALPVRAGCVMNRRQHHRQRRRAGDGPATATLQRLRCRGPRSAPVRHAAASGRFVVCVGAVSDQRVRSTAFKPAVQRVPWRVIQNGASGRPTSLYRRWPARYSKSLANRSNKLQSLSPARSNRSQVSVLVNFCKTH